MAVYKYEDIFERMMEVGEYKNASALSRDLDVTPQALSNYKTRDSMPISLIHVFSEMYMISLDWLCYGVGDRERNVRGDNNES